MEITVTDLKKCFGEKTAVDIPGLTIHAGEFLGLVGNNGAGKTTFFRLLLDLLKADSGRILLDGTDVTSTEAWKHEVGVYLGEGFLIEYLTPEEFFHFVGTSFGLSHAETDARLEAFGQLTEDILGQNIYIRNLSQGNQQKVGILSALFVRPRLLVLDEPFNFLDPHAQMVVKRLLKSYQAETGATVLLSSHNLGHTVDICERIVLLESGHVIRDMDNRMGEAGQALKDYFDVA